MNTMSSTIEPSVLASNSPTSDSVTDSEHWTRYAQGIAWGTLGLSTIVILGYISLLSSVYSGSLALGWGTLIATFLLYLAFTVAHEAGHGNIAHEIRWMKPVERCLGWLMTLPFLLVPFAMFAKVHDYHHAFTNHPDRDPDHWVSGDNWKEAGPRATTLPLHYFYLILTRFRNDPVIAATHKSSIIYYTFTLSVFVALLVSDYAMELLMIFVIPMFLVSFILGMFFDWIPHTPTQHQERYQNTRVYLFPGLKYLTLGQNYHLIHHLYPRVSWYHYARVFDLIRPELEAKNAPIETLFSKPGPKFGQSKNALEPSAYDAKHKLSLRVSEIHQDTPDAVRITFENMNGRCIDFKAGQYLTLSKLLEGEIVTRCYSICSSPNSGQLSVGVKRQDAGRMSSFLNEQLSVGDELTVSGPFGDFVYPAENKTSQDQLILIAGGSGITPILSIAQFALEERKELKVNLLYASKSIVDEMFSRELNALLYQFGDRLALTPIYQTGHGGWQGATGYLDEDVLMAMLGADAAQANHSSVYICGPEAMKTVALAMAEKIGFKPEQVFVEEFLQHAAEPEGERYQVKVLMANGLEHELSVSENQTVLQVANQEGITIPYACGVGQCGCCMMKVESGESECLSDEMPGLLPGEREAGFTLSCQCRPKGDLVLREHG